MKTLLPILIFIFFCSCHNKNRNSEINCTKLNFSFDLDLSISDYRLIEKNSVSREVFTETIDEFGYRKTPLENNEKSQPIFFVQKIDDYLIEKTYYYSVPDSIVYAIIYEFENVHGVMNGTYPVDTFRIDKIPSEEYLKCQFQNITDSIAKN